MPEGRRVGRYEILSELGRGGMARVHLARQLDLDRYVALKELGSLQREDADMVSRFLRESRLAGALNHPSIVTVLDFIEDDDGVRYIAMEYVPRGSLRPWVGKLDLAEVAGVLESVLAGLAHAHEAGIVHRDLKPENLMVTAEGRVKIADFGIAKMLADSGTAMFQTATGVALGTPAYMSPEQAMAQAIGPWTDLYAVGVIAYELLTGTVPFAGREPMAVMLAHCQQEPPPLREGAEHVPEPIAVWVHGLLAKEPGERPESARAAWDDLEEHLLTDLGPRWRRHARLRNDPDAPRDPAADTPSSRPVTPAQFPTDPRAPESDSDAWETVAGGDTPKPPTGITSPASGLPPAAPDPEPFTVFAAPAPAPPLVGPGDTAPPAAPPSGAAPAPPLAGGSWRRPRTLAISGVLVVAAVAIGFAISSGGDDDPGTGPAATASTTVAGGAPVPAGVEAVALGDRWVRGVQIVSYEPDGYTKPAFADALRRAKADGASHVVLQPLLEPASPRSSVLRVKEFAPTTETLAEGIEAATREGLKSIVEPLVYVEESYPGTYAPSNPDAFFDAYTDYVGTYADIVRDTGAEALVVGTLLSQLDGPDYSDRWTELLTNAKGSCDCAVSYAAENVDHAEEIEFWGASDTIDIAVTTALTDEATTDPAALTRAWEPLKEQLEALNARWDKPVGLGLSYDSQADQAAKGSAEAVGEPSEPAQAALFEAAFRAFQGTEWFDGIVWAFLSGDGATPKADDESFAGKQAEAVMRAWHTAT